MIDLKNLTIRKAHEAMARGDFSAVDLVSAYVNQIEKRNGTVNAFLEVYADVKEQAQKADESFKQGTATLLTGIPIALKDNILFEGHKASASSKMLENFIAPYDATAVRKLKEAGAVFIGRTNMDEFAMGGSTENSAYGVTRNPWDESKVPGGSSGGSAAAVAMDGALVALGSDTGGSVRQPASLCGCVGIKPTYGSISRHGLMAMGSSFDQIGPITKTVDDTEILFEVLKGADPLDSTSFYEDKRGEIPKKLRVGISKNILDSDGLHFEVKNNFKKSIEKLVDRGYEIVDIELPNINQALAVYYIIVPAEVSSNLARFDGVKYGMRSEGKDLLDDYVLTRREGFGKEVRRRIMLGTYVLSSGYYDAYYGKANALRSLIRKDFENALEKVDVILTPTTPTPAFPIGEKSKDPLQMYLEDIFTVPASITGNPAISIPSGFTNDEKKLPLGIQFLARPYREDILFKVSKDFLGEI
jgi:aspartyl-tRNA(Asn)/glutamyl-tRNA(Gln) amidotransferase subunit A